MKQNKNANTDSDKLKHEIKNGKMPGEKFKLDKTSK